MRNLYLVILFAALTGFVSCADEDTCTDLWAVERFDPTAIVEIDEENEALSMQITNFGGVGDEKGIAVEVYQSYFDGEFDAIATFENFTVPPATGSNGRGYVEMVMYNTNFPDTILDTSAMRVGLSATHIYAGIGLNDYQQKARLSTTISGRLEIRKHGSNLSVLCIAGGDTAMVSKVATLDAVRFGFRLGAIQDSAVTGTIGIKITQFNVVGNNGTTLYSDDFTCNSIYE